MDSRIHDIGVLEQFVLIMHSHALLIYENHNSDAKYCATCPIRLIDFSMVYEYLHIFHVFRSNL